MTPGELQYRAGIWQRHTSATSLTEAARLEKILCEVRRLVAQPQSTEVMADVLLALLGHAEMCGVSLLGEAVARLRALQDQDQAGRPPLKRKAANGN